MAKMMTKAVFTVGLLVLLMAVPAFGSTLNKSIRVDAGGESSGASSVNGSITIGEKAVVTGDVETVNGSIRIDSGASIKDASTVNGGVRLAEGVSAEDLSTVNGSIKVAESVTVNGAVEAVNGRINVEKGSTVAYDVSNVNGTIALTGAEIGGDVSTVNGDIEVFGGSVIKGNIIVEKPSNWGSDKSKSRKPRIVIGPGSTVKGNIDLEYKVDLFISETADVGGVTGVMSLDDAVLFSGDSP
jgi:cytoskeletal protein CcmA (bactofilin family)